MNEFIKNLRYILKPVRLVNLYRHLKTNRAFKNRAYVSIGTEFRNTTLQEYAWIGEDCKLTNCNIGRYSYVGGGTRLLNTKVGAFCSIAGNSSIGLGMHPTNMVSTHPVFYSIGKPYKTFSDKVYVEEYGNIEIGNDVWIGTRVIILPNVKIGDGAVIAAGSIITKDVEPYSIVGGVPAKLIRYRFDNVTIEKLIKSQWWKKENVFYQKNYKDFLDCKLFIDKHVSD